MPNLAFNSAEAEALVAEIGSLIMSDVEYRDDTYPNFRWDELSIEAQVADHGARMAGYVYTTAGRWEARLPGRGFTEISPVTSSYAISVCSRQSDTPGP